jgi:hypothetical protein
VTEKIYIVYTDISLEWAPIYHKDMYYEKSDGTVLYMRGEPNAFGDLTTSVQRFAQGDPILDQVRSWERGREEIISGDDLTPYVEEMIAELERIKELSLSYIPKDINSNWAADMALKAAALSMPNEDDLFEFWAPGSLDDPDGPRGGQDYRGGLNDLCLAGTTLIQTSLTNSTAISALLPDDIILAFDPSDNQGRNALVPCRILRLYRNTTSEWIKLCWTEAGEQKELVSTPGHHFLDQFGAFPTIAEMTRAGKTTLVLASGELAEVTAERIIYSAETAHLFERAQVQGMVAGNAALKPNEVNAWQTYNIEVEDLHTYVAGGVRVHNDSGYIGEAGNLIDSTLDRMLGGSDGDGSTRDRLTDLATKPLHMVGEVIGSAFDFGADVFQRMTDAVKHSG